MIDRSRPRKALRCLCLTTALVFALPACHGPGTDSSEFPRAQTLYIGGKQWGEPASFNPLLSSPQFPVSMNFVYECLLLFNAPAGRLEPMLAESYKINPESIEITLNPLAHWNDGKPVTADDVVYTFGLGKTFKSIPQATVWQYVTDVRALPDTEAPPGAATSTPAAPKTAWPRRVEFVLEKTRLNPLIILDALANIRINARHHLEPIFKEVGGDIEAFNKLKFDSGVVSSGPYALQSYSSEKIVLVRDDSYWGNKALHAGKLPAPKYVIHPIYKSNDHFSVALQQGRLDASNSFVPRIWLKEKKKVHT